MICFSCFTIIFTGCGTLFSFGVFQELYQTMSLEADNPFSKQNAATIDTIGTLSASIMTLFAPFATAWSKRYSPRTVVSGGGILFFLGCLLASFSHALWQFILTQGLLVGLGICFSYMPAMAVAPTWFNKKRGFALGIMSAGTGIGGLVWAPGLRALINNVGFRNALRISGAITGFLIILAGVVLDWDPETKSRLSRQKAENGSQQFPLWKVPLVDMQLAKRRRFWAHLIGCGLQSGAYYTPVFFLSTYARTLGYSAAQGANFIAINNACNAIGKICIGLIADRFGRINTLIVTTMVSSFGILVFWLPSSLLQQDGRAKGLFFAFTLSYGLFASGYISLFPASLIELFGFEEFAKVNGFLYMVRGVTVLFGVPLAGLLTNHSVNRQPGSVKASDSGYWKMAIMIGVLLFASSISAYCAKFDKRVHPQRLQE